MGLEGTGGTYESGGSKGMSGAGNDGYGGGKDKKKKDDEDVDRLLGVLKYGGVVSPVFGLMSGIIKAVEASQAKRRERMGEEAFAAEQEALAESEAKREAERNEKAGMERIRAARGEGGWTADKRNQPKPIVAPKPAPVIPPLAPITPILGNTYSMGTATVKKKKLLGGDIMQRI